MTPYRQAPSRDGDAIESGSTIRLVLATAVLALGWPVAIVCAAIYGAAKMGAEVGIAVPMAIRGLWRGDDS